MAGLRFGGRTPAGVCPHPVRHLRVRDNPRPRDAGRRSRGVERNGAPRGTAVEQPDPLKEAPHVCGRTHRPSAWEPWWRGGVGPCCSNSGHIAEWSLSWQRSKLFMLPRDSTQPLGGSQSKPAPAGVCGGHEPGLTPAARAWPRRKSDRSWTSRTTGPGRCRSGGISGAGWGGLYSKSPPFSGCNRRSCSCGSVKGGVGGKVGVQVRPQNGDSMGSSARQVCVGEPREGGEASVRCCWL
jgi:hypothetical protein